MKNVTTKVLAEVAICAALAWVLDFFQGQYSDLLPFFPQGGSVGIAMVPILVVAFRHGLLPGLLCGLCVGLMDLMDGFYAMGGEWYKVFAQVACDYWLAYLAVGLAGLFSPLIKNSKTKLNGMVFITLGSLVGGFGKFIFHFLSGLLFWPGDNEGIAAVVYSVTYNGSFMLPCAILSAVVMCLIFYKNQKLIIKEEN